MAHSREHVRWAGRDGRLAMAAALLAAPCLVSAQVTDLGCIGLGPPWLASYSYAINNRDEAVGFYTDGGFAQNNYPFIYTGGQMLNLGALATGPYQIYDYAEDVNDSSLVVGWGMLANGSWSGVRWNAPMSFDQLSPLSGDPSSYAYGVNNAGVIVGRSVGAATQAVRWLPGSTSPQPLGVPSGFANSEALDTNNVGQICGNASVAGVVRAFRYDGGAWMPLDAYPSYQNHKARKIGDQGHVVGTVDNGHFHNRAARWSADGSVEVLGLLSYPSHNGSRGFGVGSRGEVVGASFEAYVQDSKEKIRGQKPFYWTPETGMVDLQAAYASSGWNLYEACGINEAGRITGWGQNPAGAFRGFITEPFLPSGAIQLEVSIEDRAADPGGQTVEVELRPAGEGRFVQKAVATLDSSGRAEILTPFVGTFDLSLKGATTLRETLLSVPVTSIGTSVSVLLVNGDVDGDNAVTVFDYNALSSAFDAVPGDANWDERADLDGDETVSVFDYNILSKNFDLVGDD